MRDCRRGGTCLAGACDAAADVIEGIRAIARCQEEGLSAMEKKSSRLLAVRCLSAWERRRQPIAPVIEAHIHNSGLQPADRHLAVNLVQGVLRQMQFLDAIIARFSRFPLDRMKTLTLMTLRVGVFQIMFLDRIPESAAVNETVEVMKRENQPRWLLNFVNGVLRSIVRNRNRLPRPDTADQEFELPLNHPRWLVERWQARYGPDKTGEICRHNNREPQLTVRVNRLRTGPDELARLFAQHGLQARPGKYAGHSLVLESFTGPVTDLPGYRRGLFHVQDEAAQLVTQLLAPFTGQGNYLDGCAGLGGKTCQMAQLLPGGAGLYAVEPSSVRIKLLEENCRRLQLDNISVHHGRLDSFIKTAPGLFAGVLIDAPCSGTGVIRRHPDIRWNRRPEDMLSFPDRQIELLEQGASLVEPGGILVYATCSIEEEENEQVVSSFLARHADFTFSPCGHFLPSAAADMVTAEGFFASTPADGIDGFFGARLVRGKRRE